jgi:hypothetical protein
MHQVQARTWDTFPEPVRCLASFLKDALSCSNAHEVGQRQNSQKHTQAMRLADSCTFQIEAPAFESLKKALYLPAIAIVQKQVSRMTAGEDQHLLSFKWFSTQVDRYAPEQKYSRLARIRPTKKCFAFFDFSSRSLNQVILSKSNPKRDLIFSEPLQPTLSNELSVSRNIENFLSSELSNEIRDDTNSVFCMAISSMRKCFPEKWNSNSLTNDGNDKKVEGSFSPEPVGSIDGKNPGFLREKRRDDFSKLERLYSAFVKEASDPSSVGLGFCIACKDEAEFGHTDGAFDENGEQELDEEVAVRSKFSYTFSEHSLKQSGVFWFGHLVSLFRIKHLQDSIKWPNLQPRKSNRVNCLSRTVVLPIQVFIIAGE